MLIGSSGTRKSVSINMARELLQDAGYTNFAADKTSKEKFVLDLMDKNYSINSIEDLNDSYLSSTKSRPAELFIVSDEFQDFMGANNIDFITLLGRLWEGKSTYNHRVKNGKSTQVKDPWVGILGGSTPTGFGLTFPPEIVGQGFLSRLLLIYGDNTGKRISWPSIGDAHIRDRLIKFLKVIYNYPKFKFGVSIPARDLLHEIYQAHITVPDPRFASYETRRHDQLLKLCGLVRALHMKGDHKQITREDVLAANTMLYYVERRMPLALGEFGKGKFSDVSNAIMEALIRSPVPLALNELWKYVAQDLNSQNDLVGILRGLQSIDKIQPIELQNSIKFLPKREVIEYGDNKFLCPDFLTREEMP